MSDRGECGHRAAVARQCGIRRETLGRLLERQAEERGEREFVRFVDTGERLSYRAFNERCNRLTHGLLTRGVGSGDFVALMLRSRLSVSRFWQDARDEGAAWAMMMGGARKWLWDRALVRELGITQFNRGRDDAVRALAIHPSDLLACRPSVRSTHQCLPRQIRSMRRDFADVDGPERAANGGDIP